VTLDELSTLFDAACNAQAQANREDVSLWSCRGAGLKAVVEALRDEIEDTYEREGCSWDGAHAHNRMNEILASDGEGKAAGGNVTNPSEGRVIAPAADPVCVWTDVGDAWDTSCGGWHTSWATVVGKIICPACRNTIKFKEGSE